MGGGCISWFPHHLSHLHVNFSHSTPRLTTQALGWGAVQTHLLQVLTVKIITNVEKQLLLFTQSVTQGVQT